jgi:nitroreductase
VFLALSLINEYLTQENQSAMPLVDLLKKRVSIRAFLDKPVPAEIMKQIFTDAQLSPSNCNGNLGKYTLCQEQKKKF